MKKRMLLVAGLAAVVALVWLGFRGDSEDELSFAKPATASSAPREKAVVAAPVSSVLTAELPAARGELSIAGRVLGPNGPVGGAVVVATVGAGDEVLSDLPCHCTPQCTNRLVECGCTWASQRVAEQVVARRGEAPPVARATTSDDGTFVVTGLEPGVFALWAEKPGSLIGLRRGVSAGDQQADVEVSEGMTLRGKVTGDEKEPIANAIVTAVYEDHARFFDAVSGADGRFTIGPVPRGSVAVVATAKGLLPAHVSAGLGTQEVPELVLASPRTVSGRVLREGEPAVAAAVTLEQGHHTWEQTADAQGGFRFESLRPGSYELIAQQGLAFAAKRLTLESGKDVFELVLELGVGGEITGTVRSERGAPLAGVEVAARHEGRDATSDAHGRFRLGPLPAGRYAVAASAKGFLDETSPEVEVREGSASSVELVLRPSSPLRGFVVDEAGRPVANAELAAEWRAAGSEREYFPGRYGHTESKRDGSFELDGIVSGTFTLRVTHDEFRDHEEVVEAPRGELKIALRRGLEVTGTVEDENGLPQAGVMVTLRPDEELGERGQRRAMRRDEATSSRGEFRIRGVEAGRYVLLAVQRPTRELSQTMRMASAKVAVHGEGTPPVKLRFKAGQTIAGRVQTSDGAPVEGAQVSAVPEAARGRRDRADIDGLTFGGALSGPDGTFEVRNLEAGKYQMAARKEGFAASVQAAEPVMASTGDSSVSLVLKREGKIRGRVVDVDGKPVQHFAVNRSDRHDEAGAFEEPVLYAGARDVIFEADGFASTHRRVDAKIGETIDLGDVVLTRGRPLSGTVLDAATNAPIPDALVDIGDPADMERLSLIRLAVEAGAAKTGPDGSFTLPRVDTTRSLALFAFHPSYRWWVEPLDPAASRVVIKLERGGVVAGKVLDIEGNPVAGRSVVVIGSDKVVKPGRTGEDGSFELSGLPVGPATAAAEPRGEYPIPSKVFEIPAEGVAQVELREAGGGTRLVARLTGGADSRHAPLVVPGPNVATPASLNELIEMGVSGRFGKPVAEEPHTWEFPYLPAGPATLFVVQRGGPTLKLSRHALQVTGEPEQRVEIEVGGSMIEIATGP